ncbi:MAG: hypothetical protein QOD38_2169 [Acidimicrobiaceae bacterium]
MLWRWGFNLGPTLAHRRRPASATSEVARILVELQSEGVATSSIDALPSARPAFDALRAMVPDNDSTGRSGVDEEGPISLLGNLPRLSHTHPSLALTMAPELLAVADGFFGLSVQVVECKLWRSVPISGEPSGAQLWHRDRPADRRMLKCFVYLNDVGPEGGPFGYIPGTQPGGALHDIAPAATPSSYVPRVDDDAMAACVPREAWRIATGPSGTIVFANTAGYHRGGFVERGTRLALMCHYGSQAAWQRKRFEVIEPNDALDRELGFRLGRRRLPLIAK